MAFCSKPRRTCTGAPRPAPPGRAPMSAQNVSAHNPRPGNQRRFARSPWRLERPDRERSPSKAARLRRAHAPVMNRAPVGAARWELAVTKVLSAGLEPARLRRGLRGCASCGGTPTKPPVSAIPPRERGTGLRPPPGRARACQFTCSFSRPERLASSRPALGRLLPRKREAQPRHPRARPAALLPRASAPVAPAQTA